MTKEFVLLTEKKYKLRISAYGLENLKAAPCVIFIHGFKGFKDWGFWQETAVSFADAGYFVLSFNFSHNGIGENLTEFTELDKFAENTFSLEISELNEVVDAYKNNFFGITENSKIGFLGHSRGGAVAILTAAKREDITAVTVWASVAKLDRYSLRQKEKWRREGVFEVLNSRTKQVMRLNLTLLDDIEKNSADTLNIERAVKNLKKPFLIAHGDQDLAVPVAEGKQLYDWSDKNISELFIIKSAGHTFDISHPFNGRNQKFNNLLEKTITFFNSNLY
jgi:uncharacterized protein